jgi:hypothetical protein
MITVLIGSKFAGKDTLAEGMNLSSKWYRLSFADAVRAELLVAMNSFNRTLGGSLGSYLTDPSMKEQPLPGLGLTGRQMMQNWGTFRRCQRENYWVEQMMTVLKAKLDEDPALKFVVTDCRFENELDAIKRFGKEIVPVPVITVKVERPGFRGDGHVSEAMANDPDLKVDYTVTNEGTVNDLREKGRGISDLLMSEYLSVSTLSK